MMNLLRLRPFIQPMNTSTILCIRGDALTAEEFGNTNDERYDAEDLYVALGG